MEPHGHLAFRKRVGKALAEAQLSTLDGLSAAAAPGATARGGFEEVRHAGNSTTRYAARASTPVFSRARNAWICATTAAPSPIAPPTRLTEPERTSPIANTPGTLVSSGRRPPAPVLTKPLSSKATPQSFSHSVAGSAPRNRNTLRIGPASPGPEPRVPPRTGAAPDSCEPPDPPHS